VNETIAEFLLRRTSDASELARRAEILAALAQLSAQRREQLARAVDTVCRTIARHGGTARVRFALSQHEGQRFLEVAVWEEQSDTSAHGADSAGRAAAAPDSDSHLTTVLQRLGELVDRFESSGWPFHGAVIRMAQILPPAFTPPNEAEVSDWCRMLNASSPLDALSVALQRARQLATALGDVRYREDLQRELTQRGSDTENLKILSLVTSKTKNGVTIMDADGMIRWVNDAFVQMTGYQPSMAIGKRPDQLLFGPSTDAAAVRAFQAALQSGHEWTGDLMQYRRDGRTYWVESNLIPVHDQQGRLTRWIVIDNDITKRHHTEEALRAAKEAAEAGNRAKSELLANLSHEIRTPMNAIIGMTDLALTTDMTPEQQEYLQTVRSSADSLLLLLNDILDLSKIEAGKLRLEETDFHLADLVRDALKTLAVKAHEKHLELNARVAPDVPQFVRGDPARLRQVLFNLVGNAIKFTEQGEVEVEVEQESKGPEGLVLHFSVRDTGIGIPPDKRDKVFEAFAQADTSTTREFGGTGLGLTISSELVRLMQGRIWVHSEVGEGTTFHFTVQLKPSDRRRTIGSPDDMRQLMGKRVLVVDDNATNRRILAEILGHWGMAATLAKDASTAMRLLRTASDRGEPFDLVLLDAMMPDVDGFELARWIGQQATLRHGPLILLSSADQTDTSARCRDSGIEAHLTKPISASNLLEVVLGILIGTGAHEPLPISPGETAMDPRTTQWQQPTTRSLDVLVADDHDANRRLAVTILNKRGHRCGEAKNGREARELLRQKRFDVALMDIQMPVMDGCEATAAIRRMEQDTGRHLPIIALTAHAMTGDREKCLAAGMDGYLAKPLRPHELVGLVESLGGPRGAPRDSPKDHPANLTATGEFDFDVALDSLDNDVELLLEQMQFFANDGPDLIQRIAEAIAANDPRALAIAAHRLKGLLARYAYHDAVELAHELELKGKRGTVDTARATYEQLVPKVDRLVAAVHDFIARRA